MTRGGEIAGKTDSTRSLFTAILTGAGIGALLIGYALLAHYTSAVPEAGNGWAVLLAVAPLFLIGVGIARRGGAVGVAAFTAGSVALLAWAWPKLLHHVDGLYLLQHVGINGSLGLLFGRTLLEGREPLCTTFASLMQPRVSPAVLSYTRKVTVVWTGFFAVVVSASLLLYAFAPVAVWSLFANVLTGPLVATLFVCEYLTRLFVLAPEDRGGNIFAAIDAYKETMRRRKAEGS